MHKRRNSIANALDLRLSCTNPSMYSYPHTCRFPRHTVHHLKHAHGSCYAGFLCVWISGDVIHILQDYFTGTESSIQMPQCQWSNLDCLMPSDKIWPNCVFYEKILKLSRFKLHSNHREHFNDRGPSRLASCKPFIKMAGKKKSGIFKISGIFDLFWVNGGSQLSIRKSRYCIYWI